MKKGHCIICHRDEVELSDEHVIPDAWVLSYLQCVQKLQFEPW